MRPIARERAVAVREALAPFPGPGPNATMFSLGNPEVTTDILGNSGFAAIDFTEVHEPVFYGADIDVAYETLVDLFVESDAGGSAANDEVSQRLRALASAHLTAEGVLFDSRAWIVTARRAIRPSSR